VKKLNELKKWFVFGWVTAARKNIHFTVIFNNISSLRFKKYVTKLAQRTIMFYSVKIDFFQVGMQHTGLTP
jgi:hypothetical protein